MRRYDGPAHGGDFAYFLGVSPDGRSVFVTGQSHADKTGYSPDYATVAYSAITGAETWVKRYDGPAHGFDTPASLGVSPDWTTVFVTGGSDSDEPGYSADYATIAYKASSGARRWVKRFNGPANGHDSASHLAVSLDGSAVIVTGYADYGAASNADFATIAYGATDGAERWVKRYNGSPVDLDDYAESVGLSPDGSRVFVTGYFEGDVADIFSATVAYRADTGARLWAKTYDGPGDPPYDDATLTYSLAVSPDGSTVFVTGYTGDDDMKTGDYSTVAFDAATGSRLWTRQYGGSINGFDQAVSLAVSPDGNRLFVTGNSQGITTGVDFATVAYSAR